MFFFLLAYKINALCKWNYCVMSFLSFFLRIACIASHFRIDNTSYESVAMKRRAGGGMENWIETKINAFTTLSWYYWERLNLNVFEWPTMLYLLRLIFSGWAWRDFQVWDLRLRWLLRPLGLQVSFPRIFLRRLPGQPSVQCQKPRRRRALVRPLGCKTPGTHTYVPKKENGTMKVDNDKFV